MASKAFNRKCLNRMRSEYHELLPEDPSNWETRVEK